MAQRTYQKQSTEESNNPWQKAALKTDYCIGGYIRQSTERQLENESRGIQTQDLFELPLIWGWNKKLIRPYDEGGKSGQKRIDERPELQRLYADIEKGEVKTILVVAEDRLFRDKHLTQVSTFVELCAAQRVTVLTAGGARYDLWDYNDSNRFIEKMIQAYGYINDQVIGKLHKGQERKARRGCYDGRPMPMGYIVDKSIPKKERKYVIYEVHAEIVRWLFRRFKELGGKFHLLMREIEKEHFPWKLHFPESSPLFRLVPNIEQMPFHFPEFPPDIYRRHTIKVTMNRIDGGYKPLPDALRSILTNPVYLGHWLYRGALKRNNHPAIIDQELFDYAFSRLSDYTLDGEKNERPRYRPLYAQKDREEVLALLKDVIVSRDADVYAVRDTKNVYSVARPHTKLYEKETVFSVRVDWIDKIFTDRLLLIAKQDVYQKEQIEARIQEVKKKKEESCVSIDQQLLKVNKKIKRIQDNLNDPDIELDDKAKKDFNADLRELRETQKALGAKLDDLKKVKDVSAEYLKKLDDIVNNWSSMTFQEQKDTVEFIVENVEINLLAPHWFEMCINWVGPDGSIRPDLAYVWRGKGSTKAWQDEEDELFQQVYPTMPRAEILKLFPSRSWDGLMMRAHSKGIQRLAKPESHEVHKSLSLNDCAILQELGIEKPTGEIYPIWFMPGNLWLSNDKLEGKGGQAHVLHLIRENLHS